MKGIFRNAKGFTLAELLVAALFGMIVVATLYGFFREQMFNLLAQETKTATLEDARGALDMMVRELSNAGSFPLPSGYPTTRPAGDDDGSNCKRLVSASATAISIQADLDGDGNCNSGTGEFVGYALSATPCSTTPCNITRQGSITDTSPGTLVSNVIIPSGNNFFTYYPSGNEKPPLCFSTNNPFGCNGDLSSNLKTVRRVKINFSVQGADPTPEGKAAGRNITSTLYSNVDFRN